MLSFILHAGQVLNNFTCNDKTRNSRHKRSAARNLSALCAFSGSARRTDAVLAAADRHIIDGRHSRLLGVHDLELADAALAQLIAHNTRERTSRGLINIRYLQLVSVNLVARTHAADDARTGLGCLLDQLELAGYGVDRIHNVVILGEIELRSGLRRVKGFVNVDLAVRIDIVNTLAAALP